MARIASRPVTARVSDSASVAATDGLLMCTIDSLCVSSNSSACGNEAFANAALVTPTRSPLPRMRQGPGGEIATAPAANRAAESGFGARQRQAEHIQDAQLRRLDDVRRKIVVSNRG